MKLQRPSGPRAQVGGLFWLVAVIVVTLAAGCYVVSYTGKVEAIKALAGLVAAITTLVVVLIKRGGPNG